MLVHTALAVVVNARAYTKLFLYRVDWLRRAHQVVEKGRIVESQDAYYQSSSHHNQ
jgi:hypothetical protein